MRHHSARRRAPLCASYTENQLIFTSPSLTSSRAKSQRQSVLKRNLFHRNRVHSTRLREVKPHARLGRLVVHGAKRRRVHRLGIKTRGGARTRHFKDTRREFPPAAATELDVRFRESTRRSFVVRAHDEKSHIEIVAQVMLSHPVPSLCRRRVVWL